MYCLFISDAIKQVIERFGGLDILCNNAGIGNERDWRSTLAVNLVKDNMVNV